MIYLKVKDLQNGKQHFLTLNDQAKISDLITEIAKEEKLTNSTISLYIGFPQKPFDIKDNEKCLSELGIKSGDFLFYKKDSSSPLPSSSSSSMNVNSTLFPPSLDISSLNKRNEKNQNEIQNQNENLKPENQYMAMTEMPAVIIRSMKDDNSCLFSAIAYLFENHDRNKAPMLRELAAQLILSNPEKYSEGILGKKPESYVNWILKPNSWGGAIEIDLFSNYYKCEIASVDIKTLRVDIFGENQGYSQRSYLLYNGIHYDALVESPMMGLDEEFDLTQFDRSNDEMLGKVLEIAENERGSHNYTDLAKFAIKCDDCGERLRGELEAQEHANLTSHQSFSEI